MIPDAPLLYQRFPGLADAVEWRPLVARPTPITTLVNFAQRHRLASLHVKREDRTHPTSGGNKLRSLEFLLPRALARGADTLVTAGAVGSNHVASTACHARSLGLDTVAAVVAQPPAAYAQANLIAGLDAGARYIPIHPLTAVPRCLAEWVRLKLVKHRRLYYVPPGGTSPRSCLGHVDAALELAGQVRAGVLPEPEFLFVGMGSMGTAAGLMLGCKLAGLSTRVVGVVVFHRWLCTARRCAALARRTLRFLRQRDSTVPDLPLRAADLDVVTTALGGGYAHFTADAVTAARDAYTDDGLRLDGTYTAKTLAGLLHSVDRHGLHNRRLLLWHTYGPRPAPTAAQLAAAESALPRSLRRYLRERQPLDEPLP